MAKILNMTLEERMDWKFTYADIDPMLFSCICCTCGIRKPTEEEGGWLSINKMLQCFCLKAGANLAIDIDNIHYTLWRCEATGQLLDLKYEGEESPGQCTETFLCLDMSWAGQVCFCINCAAAGACGKVDGNIEQACNTFCFSYVCMLPVGTEPHNNPLTCGLCTKYFEGEPAEGAKTQSSDGGAAAASGGGGKEKPPSYLEDDAQ
mmetsp:Transcript_148310/g.210641  ORF Transcript_148310/g.210641 Transcript_148310/m.210641 type:complete len:206 (+) Transcript_148310:46-663(+)